MYPTTRQPLFFKPIVAPLLFIALLLLGSGLINANVDSVAEGAVALLAAVALQRRTPKQAETPFVC